ncbi:MAG: DUF4474 domain-containing protein [Clostridiales Family XIII bacterium]|jgi:hypothetical protein|nr:DUF4474 domain-containing protein [Clostridiales Family XIII bacterium]
MDDKKMMSFSLYKTKKKDLLFTGSPDTKSWWLTGFMPGVGPIQKNELCMDGLIDCENAGFANSIDSKAISEGLGAEKLENQEIFAYGNLLYIWCWQ